MVTAMGNIVAVLSEADPADKAKIYTQLGLQLTYEPGPHRVIAEAKPPAIMYERECPGHGVSVAGAMTRRAG